MRDCKSADCGKPCATKMAHSVYRQRQPTPFKWHVLVRDNLVRSNCFEPEQHFTQLAPLIIIWSAATSVVLTQISHAIDPPFCAHFCLHTLGSLFPAQQSLLLDQPHQTQIVASLAPGRESNVDLRYLPCVILFIVVFFRSLQPRPSKTCVALLVKLTTTQQYNAHVHSCRCLFSLT